MSTKATLQWVIDDAKQEAGWILKWRDAMGRPRECNIDGDEDDADDEQQQEVMFRRCEDEIGDADEDMALEILEPAGGVRVALTREVILVRAGIVDADFLRGK